VTAVDTRSAHNGNGNGTNGATARTAELAPFPAPGRNGHAVDIAPDGAQEIEMVSVRLWPVVKVTAFFGLATVAVWCIALALAWTVATSAGLTHSFESFMRDIGFEGFQLDARPVFLAIGLLGVAWILSVVVLALLAAASYNAFSSVFGGLRYIVRPRQQPETVREELPAKATGNGTNGTAAHDGEATAAQTAS